MIPNTHADLEALAAESRRQVDELSQIVSGLSAEALRWRPDEARWSVAGHIAHLCLVNGPYIAAMRTRIGRAGERDRARSSEPFRHPRIARWFVGTMEPPPKRRMKTMRSMVPDPGLDVDDVLGEFREQLEDYREMLVTARQLDLGRARFGSPFFGLLRFSLGTGFELVLAHNRRHIWLIRELMERDDFPAGGSGGG